MKLTMLNRPLMNTIIRNSFPIMLMYMNTHLHHILATLKRYFPTSLVAPFPNSEQLNHPSSNHTYTKSTTNHFHHHYAPFVTLTYTTHTISQLHPHTHHIVTAEFVDKTHRPTRQSALLGRWTEKLLVDHKQEDRNHASKDNGSG